MSDWLSVLRGENYAGLNHNLGNAEAIARIN